MPEQSEEGTKPGCDAGQCQLIENSLAFALHNVRPAPYVTMCSFDNLSGLGPRPSSPLARGAGRPKLSDARVLDTLTEIKRCVNTYKRTVTEFKLLHIALLKQGVFLTNRQGEQYPITTVLHMPGTEGLAWTEQQAQAYVHSVLKGLVQPRFEVNHVRGQGRLLTGILRMKALCKWLSNELPVFVNGQEVFFKQLPDQDRKFFNMLPIYFTVYEDLTTADEIEVLQTLACAGWQ